MRQRIGAHFERHHDLFERRVAGALADAVDRALDLPRAGLHGGQRVRDGQAEIVVAVRRQDRAVADARAHGREHALDIGRQRVADRVGQVDRRRAGVDRRLGDLAEEREVAARRILRRELHVVAIRRARGRRPTRPARGTARAADAQLVFEVNVGGGEEDVNARARRLRQRRPGAIDVRRDRAGQAGDDRPPHGAGNGAHRLEVAIRRDREAGLDDVHAEAIELLRQAQLLGRGHAEAGRLLAVAKRRVEHLNPGCGRHLGVSPVGNVGLATKISQNNNIYGGVAFAYSMEIPMELFQLEAFLAVVREGSFSAAAKALFRTQPAISQIIKKLEDEIGRPLFDRSSRRGVLTDAGRVLRGPRRAAGEPRASARWRPWTTCGSCRTGRLMMAANELTCLYLLPILHEYRRLYPAVHITVQRALGSRVPAQVLDYGADFGVITFRPDTDGAQLDRRLSRRARVRGAADASAGAPREGVDQRAGARVVRRASRVVAVSAKVIETFRKKRVDLQMPVEMPTIDAIKKFVAMGNGVALLPAITVEREVAHKELVRVQVPELAFDRKLRLVYRREGTLSHAAEALLAVVEAQTELRRGRYAFAAER